MSARALSTTVLAVVGPDADACVASFADAANVMAVILPDPTSEEMSATTPAREAWRRSVKAHTRFTMHDADPLAEVARCWSDSFTGQVRGPLEVAVAEALALWRAGSIGLPDYYLVLEPDSLPESQKNWYLGVLHRTAPRRVIPVASERESVIAAITKLDAGRWWPDLPEMLDGIDRTLPDQVMSPTAPAQDLMLE